MPDGEWLIPQPNACGPWFPGVQHGGSIAGLFARAIERVESDVEMFTTRISIDMSRRVPMGPTKVETDVVRNGRRVQAIEARYIVSDEVAARATATRIRVDEDLSSEKIGVGSRPEDLPPMRPEEVPVMEGLFVGFDFVRNFVMRREQTASGGAMTWARLDRQFVDRRTQHTVDPAVGCRRHDPERQFGAGLPRVPVGEPRSQHRHFEAAPR